MKQERVILSFIMVLIGLLVAGGAFYFYQSNKQISPKTSAISSSPTPVPTEKPTIFLTLDNPVNESVSDNKTITISGKTNPESTVIVLTKSDQQIIKPSSQGAFSTSITIDKDQNLISVISVLPNGENKEIKRTVTYSTTSF